MIMTRFKKCGVTDFRKTFRGLKKSRRRNKNRLTNNFDSIGGEKADDLFLKNVKVFY